MSKSCSSYILYTAEEQNGEKVTVFYVYGSVHHNIFYEITNICSYMQSILCLWFRAS